MLVSDLLAMPRLPLTPLTSDAEALAREVRWVYTTDLLEPAPFLTGGELVLTSEGWYREDADCETFAASLASGGAVAVVAGDILHGRVPEALVHACHARGIPVLAAPAEVSYSTLSRAVIDRLNRERGRELADVLGRHRRLVQALIDGADLGALTAMLTADIEIDCWALSPAGRLLAGPDVLPPETRLRLATAALALDRLPATVDGFTIHPIGRRTSGSGYLVVRGTPDATARESVAQTAELLALGGARRDERRRTEQRFHADLVDLIEQGAPAPTIAARLRAARIDPSRPLLVLTASTRGAVRPWDLAADIVESVLDTDPDTRTVLAGTDNGLTVIAAPGPALDAARCAALLRPQLTQLEPAAQGGRIAFGLSTSAPDATALPTALEQARHAAALAARRPESLALVTAAELDSHRMLLAGVPAEVRTAYRDRLLAPLAAYDAQHHAALLPTLRTFLANNGAWRATADELHVHVSTLHYRIQRIQQLTARDLSTARDRVDLYLACDIDGHLG